MCVCVAGSLAPYRIRMNLPEHLVAPLEVNTIQRRNAIFGSPFVIKLLSLIEDGVWYGFSVNSLVVIGFFDYRFLGLCEFAKKHTTIIYCSSGIAFRYSLDLCK